MWCECLPDRRRLKELGRRKPPGVLEAGFAADAVELNPAQPAVFDPELQPDVSLKVQVRWLDCGVVFAVVIREDKRLAFVNGGEVERVSADEVSPQIEASLWRS